MSLFVPESPKWLYTWFYYTKAIKILKYVGQFNGLTDRKVNKIGKIKFDIQIP